MPGLLPNRRMRARRLPLRFGGKASIAPPGERVGLIPTDMTNRSRRRQGGEAVRTELEPCTIILPPIQRGLPASRLHGGPSVRHPERWGVIATVLDKRQPVTVADEAGG